MIIPKVVCISRTDSIGDVILTIPMCGLIKEKYPDCKVVFLGKNYTKPVINCSKFVDEFIDWDIINDLEINDQIAYLKNYSIDTFIHVFPNKYISRLAKKAKIKNRIANARELHLFLNSNIKLNFTRRNSDFHEAILNTRLLEPLGINKSLTISDLWKYTGFENKYELPKDLTLDFTSNNVVILHPKSQGSAIEWGIDNFINLSIKLASSGFIVLFCGTEKEGELFRNKIPINKDIIDLTGKLTLEEYISVIAHSNYLVAASTGPLHIASLLNKKAIGLYSSRKPIHPGRWMPIGPNSKALVYDENCKQCEKGKKCNCVEDISVDRVSEEIINLN
jgi:heptosyltransferase-3